MAGPVRLKVPQGSMAPGPGAVDQSGIVVGRFKGTVVVTVHGELDRGRAGAVGYVLADLIDGQGNRSVAVDLRDAGAAHLTWLPVFVDAADRARRRGAKLTLNGAGAALDTALRRLGLGPVLAPAPVPAGR
jgi:anti-anti-sigma regulatory factor